MGERRGGIEKAGKSRRKKGRGLKRLGDWEGREDRGDW